jgi:ABC-type multidrug transport system ATPase subunit
MNILSEKSRYFLYLIEQYALYKNITGKQTLDLFKKQNIVEYIYGMYYTYHTERVENAIEDIDRKINEDGKFEYSHSNDKFIP